MKLKNPFECLTISSRKRVFIILLIITLAVMTALRAYDTHLKTEAAPNGIVSYEFAGKISIAQSMIKSWDKEGQIYAGLSLGIDYLFLVVYSLTIGLGCVMVGERLSKKYALAEQTGILLAWGLILAALLDAIENFGLIQILIGSANEQWLVIAWYSAAVKFLIVGLGLLYLIIGTPLSFFIKK